MLPKAVLISTLSAQEDDRMALLRRIAELESRLVETESFMNSEPGALIQDLEVRNSQLVMGVLWYFLTNYSLEILYTWMDRARWPRRSCGSPI